MSPPTSANEARLILAVAVDLAGGDQVVARRLLEMIVETNRATLVLLRDSVDAEAWDDAASAAHRLAGSAILLARDGLVALINELEAAARQQQRVLANTLLPHVVSAVAEFEALIKVAVAIAG
jgi:HPt (histidine-containing phosphotransfer) domain-containing protein